MKINKTEILAWFSIHLKKVLGMEESSRFGRRGECFVCLLGTPIFTMATTLKKMMEGSE